MKKIYKYIGIISLCLLSFYYTEKVANYIRDNNPIMIELKDKVSNLEVSSIDSTIINNMYIIPGLSGKKVNINASYKNMNNEYDETKVVFYNTTPSISLKDNKDKIIIRGNKEKKEVSLIFENITSISKYLIDNKYNIDLLISEEKYDTSYEMINYSNNITTYKRIDSFLKKNKLSNNLCFTKTDGVSSLCKDKYIIKPSITLNHSNFSKNLNNITNGEIIFIEGSINKGEIKLLLQYLNSQRLKITYLSNLINEDR